MPGGDRKGLATSAIRSGGYCNTRGMWILPPPRVPIPYLERKRRKQRPHRSARSSWLRLAAARPLSPKAWVYETEKQQQRSKSRCILPRHHRECHLAEPRGLPGKHHVAMVVHLHHEFANMTWPGQIKPFWDGMLQSIHKCKVRVLLGDFNALADGSCSPS